MRRRHAGGSGGGGGGGGTRQFFQTESRHWDYKQPPAQNCGGMRSWLGVSRECKQVQASRTEDSCSTVNELERMWPAGGRRKKRYLHHIRRPRWVEGGWAVRLQTEPVVTEQRQLAEQVQEARNRETRALNGV